MSGGDTSQVLHFISEALVVRHRVVVSGLMVGWCFRSSGLMGCLLVVYNRHCLISIGPSCLTVTDLLL